MVIFPVVSMCDILLCVIQDNNLAFNVAVVEGAEEHVACTVMEQKETPDGLKDEPCGDAAPDNYAGLCE